MCESRNLAQIRRSIIEKRSRRVQLMGWAGTVASLAAIVTSTGCSLDFGGGFRRCCCQTSCVRASQVSDQFSARQYTVPQAGTAPFADNVTTPASELNYVKTKFVLPTPTLAPLQSITRNASTKNDGTVDSTLSKLPPEAIDDLVDDLFEKSQKRASGFTELPVGESIENNNPLGNVVDEMNTDMEDSLKPANSETDDDDTKQSNLSMAPEEPAAIVAQLPAASISHPFRTARLPATKNDGVAAMSSGTGNNPADQSAFELDLIPRLRAVPVDKWDQRLEGVPISENATRYPRSNLSFLPNSNDSLLVLPGRTPRALALETPLEAMDFRRGVSKLPLIEDESNEAHSTLPRIHEVLR